MQPIAQIGVRHRFHTRPRARLFLLDRRLGAEAKGDILFHPAQPAARAGEHAVAFHHLALLGVSGRRVREHSVDIGAQLVHRLDKAGAFGVGVFGHRTGHNHARFVQPDMTHRSPFLRAYTLEHHLAGMPRRKRCAFADKSAKFGHLGQDHRDDF